MKHELKNAIAEQLGYESFDENNEDLMSTLKDVCTGGANCGISGFIYHAEILDWYKENKTLILEAAKEFSEELGEIGFLESIPQYNCLKDYKISIDTVGEVLFGNNYNHEDASLIIDAVCWGILEQLAFEYDR